MISPENHRRLREMLGAFTLGQLDSDDEDAIGWHLESCASCRAELSTIAPLADQLKEIDPSRLSAPPSPPAELGETILTRIRAERRPAPARIRRWALPLAASGLAAAVGLGVGYQVAPRPPNLPLESVAVQQRAPGVSSSVNVVAHTWGMEIKLTGRGFTRGTAFRVMVTDTAGGAVSAGEFVGTGAAEMRCNLNSSVLRAQATGFRVLDPTGNTVLSSRL